MDTARPASIWIRKHFIESKSVVDSFKEYFTEIIETCGEIIVLGRYKRRGRLVENSCTQ